MVLCLEIRKMSLTIWKDVPSLTIFSNSMFIFFIGQLQILASALQEMRISSFRTKSKRLSKVLRDQGMPTGIIPNSYAGGKYTERVEDGPDSAYIEEEMGCA